jgi:hypothetical protein
MRVANGACGGYVSSGSRSRNTHHATKLANFIHLANVGRVDSQPPVHHGAGIESMVAATLPNTRSERRTRGRSRADDEDAFVTPLGQELER